MRLNPLSWIFREWLEAELPKWSSAGAIAPEQEQRILEQCDAGSRAEVPRWTRLTLVALAALALGLAAILVIADRWQSIPWPIKIGPAALLMIAAHAGGYWYRFQRGDVRQGDRLFLLGSLLFGGTIWLIADRADAADEFAAGFLIWAAGTLPLALVLNSFAAVLLVTTLATVWFAWSMATPQTGSNVYLFLGFALVVGHWTYQNRSRPLLVLLMLASVLWWAMLPQAWGDGPARFYWIAALGPVLWIVGLSHANGDSFGSPYRWCGGLLAALSLPALALPSTSRDVLGADAATLCWVLPAVPIALVAIMALTRGATVLAERRFLPAAAGLAVVTILPSIAHFVVSAVRRASDAGDRATAWATILLSVIFSAAAVAVGLGLVLCAAAKVRVTCLVLGVAYLVVWAALLCRDLAGQPSVAALAFVLAGAAALGAAHYWTRSRKPADETVPAQSN